MGYEACLAEIRRAAGRELSDDELEDLLEGLQDRIRARQNDATISDMDEVVLGAADDFARAMAEAAMIEKRNAALNLKARMGTLDFVRTRFADNIPLGLEAVLVGVNRPGLGSRDSVAARQASKRNFYLGGLVSDIEGTGLWQVFVRGEMDRDIARAMWARDNGAQFTGPREAAVIAEKIHKWQELARTDLNRVGAWVKKMPGYVVRQSHDQVRISKAGYEAWRNEILPRLDPVRTFQGADPEKFLQGVYKGLASGVHMKAMEPGDVPSGFKGPRNIAKKLSAERTLHFKSADDWFDYNARFGSGSLREAVLGGLTRSADAYGLMSRLGTNPEANLSMIAEFLARAERDPAKLRRLDEFTKGRMRHFLAWVDGSARIAGNMLGARVSAGVRAVQSMSKLGGAVFSAVTDVAFYGSEMRYQGRNVFEGMGEAVGGLFKGRNRKEMADIDGSLGVMMDGMIGDLTARFSIADDNVPGRLSRLQTLFFKYNGLQWWTDTMRANAHRSFSHYLARQRETAHSDLNPDLRRALELYGIDEPRWDVIRASATKEADGRDYLTPEAVREIPDELIDRIVADKVRAVDEREQAMIARIREADATDRDRLAARAQKLKEAQDRADAAIAEARARREQLSEKGRAAADARIELLRVRQEEAAAKADLAREMATTRAEGTARRLLDEVERGRNAFDVAPRSDANVGRISDRADRIGRDLGRRIGNAERRAVEIEGRLRQMERDLAKTEAAAVDRATERVAAVWKDMLDYSKRVDARMAARQKSLDEYQASMGKRVDRIRQGAREELADQLRTYMVDRADIVINQPDARVRATLLRDTRPGTVWGELARFLIQFKSFPISVIQRSMGREVYGRGANSITEALRNGNGEMVGLASLIATATLFGYVAMSAKDILKGRTPREIINEDGVNFKVVTAAMVQGGGMGIYGDFLFGQVRNRFGGSFIDTLAGPTAGAVSDIADLWGRVRDGDDAAAKAISTIVSNTPFANLFYTRIVLDYLILYQLKEWLSPGSLRRMERRVEKENAQTFMIRPSEVVD